MVKQATLNQPIIKKARYTKGEEIFHAVSHIVGGAFGIAALILLIVFGVLNQIGGVGLFAVMLYGISIIIMYTMSSIYHFLRPNRAKKLFRIFDHCGIYLLIAGTYTPYCLIALGGTVAGFVLIGVIWGFAVLGIVLKAVSLKSKFVKVASMISYIVLGWAAVFAFGPLIERISTAGLWLLIAGGIAYTVGAVFYMFGRKKKGIHSVWHMFVLGGSILHFLSILLFVVM